MGGLGIDLNLPVDENTCVNGDEDVREESIGIGSRSSGRGSRSDGDEEGVGDSSSEEEMVISDEFLECGDEDSNGECSVLDEILDEKLASEIRERDVRGLEFSSVDEAESFYRKYAFLIGFGVQRDMMLRNIDEVVLKRRWVCSRAGLRPAKYMNNEGRSRRARGITRVKCRAALRI